MRHAEAGIGRTFVIRLEDGDRLPGALEDFAREHGVARGVCLLLGGAGGGRIVVGPERGEDLPPLPVELPLVGVHEMAGVGTIFPDAGGAPSLHLHAAFGRGAETKTGCIRPGVDVWKVAEVVLLELVGTTARRAKDLATGFTLLEP
jgi:predicted DNA-binding protein with PD1-like motif